MRFHCRENRHSLATLDHKEITHLGALKMAQFCGRVVKIAAVAAENGTIFVHSDWNHTCLSVRLWPSSLLFCCFAFCFAAWAPPSIPGD